MARKRLLDTEDLFYDKAMWQSFEQPERGILFYERLWALAEDWGGFEWDPETLSKRMGYLNTTPDEVEGYLKVLSNSRLSCIVPFEVEGNKYGWIKSLLKRQPLNNPAPPKLPLPPWIKCRIIEKKPKRKSATYAIIESKIPVGYMSPTGNLRVNTRKERAKRKEKVSPPYTPPLKRKEKEKRKECAQQAELIFSQYPKKADKNNSIKSIISLLENPPDELKPDPIAVLKSCVSNYKAYIEREKTQKQYVIQSNNFFGKAERYKEFLRPILNQRTPTRGSPNGDLYPVDVE